MQTHSYNYYLLLFLFFSPHYIVLNQFMQKLDNRYDRSLKTTKISTVKRDRAVGAPSTSQPPISLPSWMIDPSYKRPTPIPTSTTVCMDPAVDPDNSSCEISLSLTHTQHTLSNFFISSPLLSLSLSAVGEEVTYTSLIGGIQDVRDDSSDFELPDSIVS